MYFCLSSPDICTAQPHITVLSGGAGDLIFSAAFKKHLGIIQMDSGTHPACMTPFLLHLHPPWAACRQPTDARVYQNFTGLHEQVHGPIHRQLELISLCQCALSSYEKIPCLHKITPAQMISFLTVTHSQNPVISVGLPIGSVSIDLWDPHYLRAPQQWINILI